MPPKSARELRILQASSELFTHYGYDKTTINDIARTAGISKGAVYLHFKSKEELFEVLILYETQNVMDEVMRRIENHPDGGTFFHFYSTSLLVTAENPLMRALLTQDKRVIGVFVRQIQDNGIYAQMRPMEEMFIRQFQEAGLLRTDLSVDMIIYLLYIFRIGFFFSHDLIPQESIPDIDEFSRVLPVFLDSALATPDGDREKGKQIIADLIANYKQALIERDNHE